MSGAERGSDRRTFLVTATAVGAAFVARAVQSQEPAAQQNFAPMEEGAYRPTLRAAKPDATPQLSDDERDVLEHRIKCQCGCPLDIYTCRTTDFTCSVSPAMHRDVMRLVAGGYDAKEILAAFVETYGEVALTEPTKQGFNWAGYLAPGIAMATGAIALTLFVRKWVADSRTAAAVRAGASMPGAASDAMSDDDRARLERALREDA